MNKYELIDHTADIGLRIFGRSLAELFENAGVALFDTIVADIDKINLKEKRSFQLERESIDELLVEWLGGLLFLFDAEQLVFRSFNIMRIDSKSLLAEAEGERFKEDVHQVKTAVKAVTYHNLSVAEKNEKWEATVILDV